DAARTRHQDQDRTEKREDRMHSHGTTLLFAMPFCCRTASSTAHESALHYQPISSASAEIASGRPHDATSLPPNPIAGSGTAAPTEDVATRRRLLESERPNESSTLGTNVRTSSLPPRNGAFAMPSMWSQASLPPTPPRAIHSESADSGDQSTEMPVSVVATR